MNYATANGTATQPADYTTTSGTLTFTPGQVTKTISVPVVGDALDEIDETFVVNLSVPDNVTIADNQGVGDDHRRRPAPSLTINDVTLTEGDAGTANMTFTVTLSAASGKTVTVDYATADGTATVPGRLHRVGRHADVHPGQHHAGRSPCPSSATRSTSSTRRSSPTSRTRRTPRSPTTRASARSSTTTRSDA